MQNSSVYKEVGRLILCCSQPLNPQDYSLPIAPNQEFDIGRRHFEDHCGVEDLTISVHHLRFRCVVYDAENEGYDNCEDQSEDEIQVPPMVYARVLSSNPIELVTAGAPHGESHVKVRKVDGDKLLNDGDVLYLTPHLYIVFCANDVQETVSDTLDPLQQMEVKLFEETFCMTSRKLGWGGQSTVVVALKQPSGQQIACKIPHLAYLRQKINEVDHDESLPKARRLAHRKEFDRELKEKRDQFLREHRILQQLSHPNIISVDKMVCTNDSIYIFEELLTGGDLLSYISRIGALGEAHTAVIVRQLLMAVAYLHDNEIVHRDIKPENILMTSWQKGARVVLTDFGQSRPVKDVKAIERKYARMQTPVGTAGYRAPEVLETASEQGYSQAIDIWSVGCVTAFLTTSEPLFPDRPDVCDTKRQHPGDQDGTGKWGVRIMETTASWHGVGRKLKSFVKHCLRDDERRRPTAKQALQHPWFTNRHYAAELEAAYDRAIGDWQPRDHDENPVMYFDTSELAGKLHLAVRAHGNAKEVKSKYWGSSPVQPSSGVHDRRTNLPNSYRKHEPTPLPSVREDAIMRNANTNGTNAVLHQPHETSELPSTVGRMSIEDYAPPSSQLTRTQPDWGFFQSQNWLGRNGLFQRGVGATNQTTSRNDECSGGVKSSNMFNARLRQAMDPS